MSNQPANGERQDFGDKPCVYYDGYWIRRYDPPDDNLLERKNLINALTRRLFHHSETGINTPGFRLEEARLTYENESDPAKRRVKAAMYAGSLFNRATDILKKLVEIQELGVDINEDSELLKECENCLMAALDLGPMVRHHSGAEGLEELWGEPFKAFTMPVAEFYTSRYIKIAQTMADIDRIADRLVDVAATKPILEPMGASLRALAESAKAEIETQKSDPVIFEVWSNFVAASDYVDEMQANTNIPRRSTDRAIDETRIQHAFHLLKHGKALILHMAAARVPMPESAAKFLNRCDGFLNGKERRNAGEGPHV